MPPLRRSKKELVRCDRGLLVPELSEEGCWGHAGIERMGKTDEEVELFGEFSIRISSVST